MSNSPKFSVPKVYFNAEFQRLIWLNFSVALLIIIHICYAFFIYISSVDIDGSLYYVDVKNTAWIATILFSISSILIIQRSFSQDIQSHFWDQIRMSTLTPWQIAWTRLFIAPILSWIGLVVSAILIFISQSRINDHSTFFDPSSWISITFIFSLNIFIGSIFIINKLQFKRSYQEWNGSYLHIILTLILFFIYFSDLVSVFYSASNFESIFFDHHDSLHTLIILVLISAISLFSLYKSMSYKMHLRPTQRYWLILALISPYLMTIVDILFFKKILYIYDMTYDTNIESTTSIILFNFTLYLSVFYPIACFLSLLAQDNRISVFKSSIDYFKSNQWGAILNTLPLWVILTPIYMITLGLVLTLISSLDPYFYTNTLQDIQYHPFSLFGLLIFTFLIHFIPLIIIYIMSSKLFKRFNSITITLVIFLMIMIIYKAL